MFPNELFFLRPIGEDLTVTGHSLRLEEKQETARRAPGVPDDYKDDMDFAPRDFHSLCRGDTVVSNIILHTFF